MVDQQPAAERPEHGRDARPRGPRADRGAALLADATDTRTAFTPVLDLHAGVSRTVGIWTLTLGYQMQQWFGVSELLTFGDDVHVGSLNRRRGDFGMDGFFVRLGVTF